MGVSNQFAELFYLAHKATELQQHFCGSGALPKVREKPSANSGEINNRGAPLQNIADPRIRTFPKGRVNPWQHFKQGNIGMLLQVHKLKYNTWK